MIDDPRLQIRLGIGRQFRQARKLQNVRFLDRIFRTFNQLSLPGKFEDLLLAPAQGQPFVQGGIELAFKFPKRPTPRLRLNLIESPLRFFHAHQEKVMGPTQRKARHCPIFTIDLDFANAVCKIHTSRRFCRRCLQNHTFRINQVKRFHTGKRSRPPPTPVPCRKST